MRIEEQYRKTGYFWLPEKEDKKIPGLLSISDSGCIDLEIVGLFDESIDALKRNDDIDRIIGHVENDGLVTLDNCFYIKKSFPPGGISKSKIYAHRALIGAAWGQDEPVSFNTFSFAVDCLDEWIGISGISVDYDRKRQTAKVSYNPPEKIGFTLDNGMKLEICFSYKLPSCPSLKEAKITQKAYFKLESGELCDLNDFTTIAFKITHLMCFAMDAIVAIKNVSATSSEIQRDLGDGTQYSVPIKIYYQSIPFSEKVPKRTWHQDMIFSYAAIKHNAQQVFNSWISAYEYLAPAFGLYFSTKIGAQKYLDGKFLALAQGLEVHHRRTNDEKLMEPEVFQSLVSTVLAACPDAHIDWLKGRLMHGNEINLAKRLKRLIEPFKEYLGTSNERSKFIRKVVDIRHYLTHYNQNLEDEFVKGRELWTLCLKMEVIFNLHFLNIVGFTAEEIKTVVENCQPLKRKLQKT
ncbi:hypothetical protein QE177_11905 [Arsenophonus sp. aPb]|uniref:ApeA N-terminal domain 1-containing protein n=1 Tax=Arsenophonus sp. aPb TaxID=3041619 RepID=UPI00246974EE|nr:HEPN domain-containing protein [Arsenophonus sp. aPb]WGL97883.1 hypothetical protein QE177_11905 [Arsenophonus sp. aPb]